MGLIFEPVNHTYTSVDNDNGIPWLSVTGIVSKLKQPFNADEIALKSSRKKGSKWYGLSVDEIKTIWKNESNRACDLGNWYHELCEKDINSCETMERHGEILPVIRPVIDESGRKISSSQILTPGIYPEHLVYLNSTHICGQSDLVEVVNGKVNILDHKTNKEMKTRSFVSWEGIPKKMQFPVSHLEDCDINHYALQLSFYMYMILKHNPNYTCGNLTVNHIAFEEEDEKDKYGYPISKKTPDGEFIVKELTTYDLPYLKDEVHTIIDWMKDNRHKLEKKW